MFEINILNYVFIIEMMEYKMMMEEVKPSQYPDSHVRTVFSFCSLRVKKEGRKNLMEWKSHTNFSRALIRRKRFKEKNK